MTPEERRQRADWQSLALAVKMAAGGMCICGRRFVFPFLGMNTHHKTDQTIGNEPLWHLAALCAPCHANLHWRKKYGDLVHVKASEKLGLIEPLRMAIEDCSPFYWAELRHIDALLDEAKYRLEFLVAATTTEREWNEGRRAA